MPCESLEVSDWFGQTLFKINPMLLADYVDSANERERAQRRARFEQGEDLDPNKLDPPELSAMHELLGDVLHAVGVARLPAARALASAGLRMPETQLLRRDVDERRKTVERRLVVGDDHLRESYIARARERCRPLLFHRIAASNPAAGSIRVASAFAVRKEVLSRATVGFTRRHVDKPAERGLMGAKELLWEPEKSANFPAADTDLISFGATFFHAHAQGNQPLPCACGSRALEHHLGTVAAARA